MFSFLKSNTTHSKEIGVQTQMEENSNGPLAISDKDRVVNWDSKELQRPTCSWSSFPPKPSKQLESIIALFDSELANTNTN